MKEDDFPQGMDMEQTVVIVSLSIEAFRVKGFTEVHRNTFTVFISPQRPQLNKTLPKTLKNSKPWRTNTNPLQAGAFFFKHS